MSKENDFLKEEKERMIKDLSWSIEYHKRKLAEEEAKLQIVLNSKI